ncbi:MAG: MFS transporter [Gemmatimonadota bacterium]
MLRRGGLSVLFAAVLVDMVGFGIVLPLLPFYAESFGASPFEVTLIIASFAAAQLLTAPLWGRVSDRHGRRPMLLTGLFASALSYLIFALAHSIPILLLSRVAAGAAGGTVSVAQAYVADSTDGPERAHGLGLMGAASGLGIMFGPAIGGFFSQWGLGVPGLVAAGLCALNGAAALVFLPESRRFRAASVGMPVGGPAAGGGLVGQATEAEGGARAGGVAAGGLPAPGAPRAPALGEAATLRGWVSTLSRFPLSLLLRIYFLSITAFAAMTSVLALYLERVFGMGASEMGVLFTVAGGVTVVVRGGAVGRLVRRIGEPRTVRIGTVVLAASIGGIALIPNRWWLALLIPSWALGTGILFPSLASLVSRATDAHSQGSILGGTQFVGGLGRVIGPLWAGLLFQHVGLGSPFAVASGLVLFGLLLAFRIPAPGALRPAAGSRSRAVEVAGAPVVLSAEAAVPAAPWSAVVPPSDAPDEER